MAKSNDLSVYFRAQLDIARCFPDITLEVRDLLWKELSDIPVGYVNLESAAIVVFLVKAEVITFEDGPHSDDLERVWLYMQCYISKRLQVRGMRVNSKNFEKHFSHIALAAHEVYYRAIHKEQLPPQSREDLWAR